MTRHVIEGNVVLSDGILERGQVVIENGVIQEVAAPGTYPATTTYHDAFISPGFIDIHVHGIAGADTMDASAESIHRMAERLATHGVTSFLPTTVTQDLDLTGRTVETIRHYMASQESLRGAEVVGIHLEGPWISKDAKGAQNEDFIVAPELETIESLIEKSGHHVRKITMAPELPGAHEVMKALAQKGVQVSVGHTVASYEEALEAFEAGATHVTHCFNAMTGLHHRKPGVVGAAMLKDEIFTELIADGIHVHPAVMQILLKVKTRERVMLISDSISAADVSDGTYDLGGQAVYVHEGCARLADGTLAGSTLTLDRAVRNVVNLCGQSLVDAVYMASTVPAIAIGFGDKKGRIATGYDADLVILDKDLQPINTIVAKQIRE